MGQKGSVFRAPLRDRHGDAVDEDGSPVDMHADGLAYVGDVKNIVMGGASAYANPAKGEESSKTVGMIGCPRRGRVKIQFGDRVDISGVRYQVVSNPLWDYRHGMSGTDFGYYWLNVQAVMN